MLSRKTKVILFIPLMAMIMAVISCDALERFGETYYLDLTAESEAATAIAPTWTPTATFTPTATLAPAATPISVFPGKELPVDAAAFSTRRLAIADLNSLNIFRDDIWINVDNILVNRIVFSPDGRTLLAGDNTGLVFILNSDTGIERTRVEAHSDRVNDLAYAPYGDSFATAGEDGRVTVWDAEGEIAFNSFSLSGSEANGVAWNEDGDRLLGVTSNDGRGALHIWDIEGNSLVERIDFDVDLTAITHVEDDFFLIGAADGSVFGWDMDGNLISYVFVPQYDSELVPVKRIEVNGAGGAAIMDEGGIVRIIWIESGTILHRFGTAIKKITAIDWSIEESFLLGAGDQNAPSVWAVDISDPMLDLPSGGLITLTEPESWWGLNYEALDVRLTGSELVGISIGDQSLRWGTGSEDAGTVIRNLYGTTYNLSAVALSNDGGMTASAQQNGQLTFADISGEAYEIITATTDGESGALALAFTPDDRYLVAGAEDGSVTIWNSSSGAVEATLETFDRPVVAVGVSADGGFYMAADEGGTAKIWAAKNGEYNLTHTFDAEGEITAAAFSPDGRFLVMAAAESQSALLYDAESGELFRALPLGTEALAITLGPDGLMGVCGADQHITVWSAPRGEKHYDMNPYTLCRIITFNEAGTAMAAGLASSAVSYWEIDR